LRILSLSGFIPEQIVDVIRFSQYYGSQRILHYCGYAADYISQVLEDNLIDGAVFPRSCDSTRIITDYLSDCGKFTYQLNIPARQDALAIDYLALNIRRYKEAVEQYFGIVLDNISERTEMVNKRNRKLAEIYTDIAEFSYADYLNSIHAILTRPLSEQQVILPRRTNVNSLRKQVYIVGSFISNTSIVSAIENAGLTVAGENLTESKRLFSAPPVSINGDIYRNIAESILRNKLSPTQNNFREILIADLNEIKRKSVKGVIFVTQKYCEPYDYLFASYKHMLDDNNIPVLRLVLSNSTDSKNFGLALEAFADII
jgi:benzoyl-CoA reductase/2-hydroxyglutaryl-CoA dehydratase subunit BcrC/BadD/HgdB